MTNNKSIANGSMGDYAGHSPSFSIPQDRNALRQNDHSWKEIFESNQKKGETVEQYSNRITELVKDLSDLPKDLQAPFILYRVRSGIRDAIKRILLLQIVQPTSLDTLVRMATAIERDMDTPDTPLSPSSNKSLHDTVSIRHAQQPLRPLSSPERPQQYQLPPQEQWKEPPVGSQALQVDTSKPPPPPSEPRFNRTRPTNFRVLGRHHHVEGTPETVRDNGGQGSSHNGLSHPLKNLPPPPPTDDGGAPSEKVSETERKRRKAEGCCYGCGQPGHMRGECPTYPRKRAKRV